MKKRIGAILAIGLTSTTALVAVGESVRITVNPPTKEELKIKFRVEAITHKPGPSAEPGTTTAVRLAPFADAGATGAPYKVWLAIPPVPSP